jgi:hypothetical protein
MVNSTLKILLLVAVVLQATPALAADERLPAKMRVAILLKALTYDHNLKTRCAGGLRIGVVSLSGNETSASVATETLSEIRANAGKKVKGLGISVVSIGIASIDQLKNSVSSNNVNTLYLSPGLGGLLGPILDFAREKKILVLTGEAPHVKSGAAIGAVLRDQKPKILVHLKAADRQGAKLDARLLRLVEVVQ